MREAVFWEDQRLMSKGSEKRHTAFQLHHQQQQVHLQFSSS
jgi:hypothetical protein